ncbi:MAG: FAD-dependent monooxygenase, partial [Phaeodactylibacter sp.]|nr:FAD-dependent monooxygenase [Phaeodactylibacter sp.]
MKGIIIGGGIGGLTTALRFQQLGLDFEVFEQATAFQPVGAGIVLAENALGVYRRLGIDAAIRAAGLPFQAAAILNQSLQPISRLIDGQSESVAIHRAALHRVLLEHLPEKSIRLSKQLVSVEEVDDGLCCLFEDGTEAVGDFVIGA